MAARASASSGVAVRILISSLAVVCIAAIPLSVIIHNFCKIVTQIVLPRKYPSQSFLVGIYIFLRFQQGILLTECSDFVIMTIGLSCGDKIYLKMYKNICLEQKSTRRESSVKKKKPYDRTVFRSIALIMQFGINMLVPICLMSAVGVWMDKHFGTNFWMILLFCMGAVAGGQNVYRMARTIYDDSDEKHTKKDK